MPYTIIRDHGHRETCMNQQARFARAWDTPDSVRTTYGGSQRRGCALGTDQFSTNLGA